jgi:hypothetical protein
MVNSLSYFSEGLKPPTSHENSEASLFGIFYKGVYLSLQMPKSSSWKSWFGNNYLKLYIIIVENHCQTISSIILITCVYIYVGWNLILVSYRWKLSIPIILFWNYSPLITNTLIASTSWFHTKDSYLFVSQFWRSGRGGQIIQRPSKGVGFQGSMDHDTSVRSYP